MYVYPDLRRRGCVRNVSLTGILGLFDGRRPDRKPDNGEEHQYHPDFIAVLDDGRGALDPLNLIVEVTGEKKKEKAAKVMTARTLWVPAVNNHEAFGRWGFIEIDDPWDAESTIRGSILGLATNKGEGSEPKVD
jgi:hypothetical protein